MAWFRVHLDEEQQRIVNEERVAHPDLPPCCKASKRGLSGDAHPRVKNKKRTCDLNPIPRERRFRIVP